MNSMIDRLAILEYEDACCLVEETEHDLANLKRKYEYASVDVVKGSNPNFPYEPRTFRIEGVDYAGFRNPSEISQLEAILKERKRKAQEKRLAVEYWMNTVPPRIARIVRMKYFLKKSWAEVAMALGMRTPDAARMELKRYIRDRNMSENDEII